jgi:hypothetical protein
VYAGAYCHEHELSDRDQNAAAPLIADAQDLLPVYVSLVG